MKGFNSNEIVYFAIITAVLTVATVIYAQQKTAKNSKNEVSCPLMKKQSSENKSHEDCPMIKKDKSKTSETETDNSSNHNEHHAMVVKNGAKEMGFSQTETTHHFLMTNDGGAIQVETNNAKDIENRDKIRKHLAEIAKMFQNGIFTTPFAVHGQVPLGVPEMDQLKNDIRYAYEETEKGARVRISTDNPTALESIHKFLKFQIEDHQTSDPLKVRN